jgi:hypothetical protein
MRGLMIQQTISAPRWWKQMSLLVLLSSFKTTTGMYEGHLSTPLPAWRNSVRAYIILGCARTDDPADDFYSKMVEIDVVAHLVGFLQDGNLSTPKLSMDAITTLTKFGRSVYHFGMCED